MLVAGRIKQLMDPFVYLVVCYYFVVCSRFVHSECCVAYFMSYVSVRHV